MSAGRWPLPVQASFKPLGFTVAVAQDRAIESLMQVGDRFVLNCLPESGCDGLGGAGPVAVPGASPLTAPEAAAFDILRQVRQDHEALPAAIPAGRGPVRRRQLGACGRLRLAGAAGGGGPHGVPRPGAGRRVFFVRFCFAESLAVVTFDNCFRRAGWRLATTGSSTRRWWRALSRATERRLSITARWAATTSRRA